MALWNHFLKCMQITSVIRIHAAVFTEGGPPLSQDIINEMFPVHGHPPHYCCFATLPHNPKISNTNQNMLVSVFVGCRPATVALIHKKIKHEFWFDTDNRWYVCKIADMVK